MFWLSRGGRSLLASGLQARVAPGPASTLEHRVRAFFDASEGDEPQLIVGALPFDRDAEDMLFQPLQAGWSDTAFPVTTAAQQRTRQTPAEKPLIVGDSSAIDYAAAVSEALSRIARAQVPALEKVVLARQMRLEATRTIDPCHLLERLSQDPAVATYLVDLSPASGVSDHLLIGATPEPLIARTGLDISSWPLAGSAARSTDTREDEAAAEGLLASAKELREHDLVVEAILDGLAPYCAELSAPTRHGLRSTDTMWHLGTQIEGRLKSHDAPSAAGLAAILHPTPAVGGYPRDLALDTIRELEPNPRGFYAGAVGWTDRHGDGEFHVALRCAEIRGSHLTLHAGAGIVAGSQPDKEVAETSAKFRAMLQALGVDEGAVVEASA